MDLTYDSKIGRGAFADVWLATDALGRNVAVKFFNDTAPTQAELNALNHAKALARVDSPAVVRVIALERQRHPETDVDCLVIIMEHISGANLSLHHGSLATELALAAIRDLAMAVAAIHSAGLVHGDLHDGNVLITPTGAKVVDILYTHSLAEVGTRTATRTRDDDLRDLAVLFRQIIDKAGQGGPSLAEAYYQATTASTNITEMADIFSGLLTAQPERVRPATRKRVVAESNESVRREQIDRKTEASTHGGATASAIIAKLQSGVATLSACVADALTFAVAVGDKDLKLLCERELVGYGNAGEPPAGGVGPRQLARTENVEYRQIQFYVSLGAEINIDYFGSGQRAIAWMQSQPKDFQPLKMLYPKPVAEVERDARQSTVDKLISIRMPASALVPNTKIPDAPLICYARGDAFVDLLDRIKTHLTTELLRHAAVRPSTVRTPRDNNVFVNLSKCSVAIGGFSFQLRPGTAPEPASISFTTPQAGPIADSWDVYLSDKKVGWFSITVKRKDGTFRVAEARTYVPSLPATAHAECVARAWVDAFDVGDSPLPIRRKG